MASSSGTVKHGSLPPTKQAAILMHTKYISNFKKGTHS